MSLTAPAILAAVIAIFLAGCSPRAAVRKNVPPAVQPADLLEDEESTEYEFAARPTDGSSGAAS